MELYYRSVTLFDQELLDDFAKEHKENNEIYMAGDCSLILNSGYQQIGNFYKWFKLVSKLDREENLKKGQVGCSCYLVLNKEDDSLIGLFDIRHSLDYKNGEVFGHIGVDIRPSQRGKGFYKTILNFALEEIKNFSINPVVISCSYDNIVSYKGITDIFGDYEKMIPVDGTYFYVFSKEVEYEHIR